MDLLAVCLCLLFALIASTNTLDVSLRDNTDPNIPDVEYSALQDLYDVTGGSWWIYKKDLPGAHWNFTEIEPNQPRNPCAESWQGLNCTCTITTCNIIVIKLDQYNLTGSIPNSIGSFPEMVFLNLYGNYLRHAIPSTIGQLTSLTMLFLNGNILSGSIPDEIGNLTLLEQLDVSNNALSGLIPSTIFENLLTLSILYLDRNSFRGPLPSNMGMLQNLTELTLAINPFLDGPIPDSIGNMTSLYRVLAYSTILSGTLPDSIGNLKNMEYFEFYDGKLEGSIPYSMCKMTMLSMFAVHKNKLTGTIPDCIGDITYLQQLYLFTNKLTGQLPDSLYNLNYLMFLEIYSNHLSGTLSSKIGIFQSLYYLQINFNDFTGTLPSELSTLVNMYVFDVSDNSFTGPIPNDMGSNWPIVQYVMLYDNFFTSTIPASLGDCSTAIYFLISDNHMEGTLPDNLKSMTALQYIDVRWNHFTGTITEALTHLTNLFYIALSTNYFTGTIPGNITDLPVLKILFLDENKLTGSLSDVFNISIVSPIVNIDISQNDFTGTIPSEAFKLQNLSTFAANTNCFSGSIPPEICEAPNLNVLVLDGISSGENCRVDLFPELYRYIKTYGLRLQEDRVIPECLYTMPKLETLHLAGNSITGALPSNLSISKSLVDLSLSHNDFLGSIPDEFMMLKYNGETTTGRVWLNLDLSYNRLKGTLSNDLEPLQDAQSFYMQENRISGDIPHSLRNAEQISILEGNIFACDLTGTDLPVHDETTRIYECGSKSFDISIYFWIALFLLLVIVGIVIRTRSSNGAQKTYNIIGRIRQFLNFIASERRLFLAVFDDETAQSLSLIKFNNLLKRIRKVCIALTIFILFVCLPTFSVLTSYYGTYDYEYAWFYSAAFLSGKIAAIAVFTTLVLLILLLVAVYCNYLQTFEWIPKIKEQFMLKFYHTVTGYGRRKHTLRFYAFIVCLIIFNCAVVLTVNGLYIYITLTYSRSVVTVAQILIAMFKLFWNSHIVFDYFAYMKRVYFSKEYEDLPIQSDDATTALSLSYARHSSVAKKPFLESRDVFYQTFIVMFNNIAAPCLAVCVVSSTCFYYALFRSPAVNTSYAYYYCTLYLIETGVCAPNSMTREIVGTTYNPPFVYTYACSSAFITTYASVFVYKYIIRAFVVPIVTFGCGAILKYAKKKTLFYRMINVVTPRLVKPIKINENHEDADVENDPDVQVFSQAEQLIKGNKEAVDDKEDNKQQVFMVSKFLVNIVCNIGIMITFGAVFPPLAIVICLSILVNTKFVQLMIGRLLVKAEAAQQLHYCYRIDEDCDGAERAFKHVIWLLLKFACFFYSLFVFDILGDAEGWKKALWAPMAMVCIPTGIFVCVCILKFVFRCLDKEVEMVARESTVVNTGREVNVMHGAASVSSSGL